MIDTFLIIVFIVLIILSAFFSGSETAYFNLKTHHDDVPQKLKDLLLKPRHLLVSILTGNTIINVGIGSLAALITMDQVGNNTNIMIKRFPYSLFVLTKTCQSKVCFVYCY